MPGVEVDILDEPQPRLVVGDLADEEAVGIPAVEDVADVEDDGVIGEERGFYPPSTVRAEPVEALPVFR